jgi:hypothetical protein
MHTHTRKQVARGGISAPEKGDTVMPYDHDVRGNKAVVRHEGRQRIWKRAGTVGISTSYSQAARERIRALLVVQPYVAVS